MSETIVPKVAATSSLWPSTQEQSVRIASTILQAALMEARSGRRVFLLAPGTKEPLKDSKGFYDGTTDEAEIIRRFSLVPNANYGITLADTDLIVDADPRNYPPDRDIMVEIMRNFQLPRTRVIATPSGGYHFYFTKPAATKIRKKQTMFPGIDFLSDGCYVVGPGSIFEGKEYRNLESDTLADATVAIPPHFTGILEPPATPQPNGTDTTLAHLERFKIECRTRDPGLDPKRYNLALDGRDMALPLDAVYEAMRDFYNPRCNPVWTDKKLSDTVMHAFKYARNAVGAATPEAAFKNFASSKNLAGFEDFFVSGEDAPILGLPCGWEKVVPHGYILAAQGLSQKKGKEPNQIKETISGPIVVTAFTRGVNGENESGLVLEFLTIYGTLGQATIPSDRLHQGGGSLLAQELAKCGFSIEVGKEQHLATYLRRCRPTAEYIAVGKTGWVEQEELVFIFPDGATDEKYRFQPERLSATNSSVKSSGTLQEWRDNVLVPASSSAFCLYEVFKSLSATLLNFSVIGTGGEHIYGPSSTGKTTVAQIGASVWGCGAEPSVGPSYIHRWNTTGNAIEAMLAQHNDLPVYFDELGSFTGDDLGSVLYNMCGGIGKEALDQARNRKAPRKWRTLITSTGELSVRARIEQPTYGQKKNAKAGQLLRFLDRPIGVNNFASANQVDILKRSCSRYYGTLGPMFIERIIAVNKTTSSMQSAVQKMFDASMERLLAKRAKFDSVQQRAMSRFALAEVAGKLLVEFQLIPGLLQGHVTEAIDKVIDAWAPSAQQLGDDARAINSLREFIIKNRDTRFKEYNEVTFPSKGQDVPVDSFSSKVNRELAGIVDDKKRIIYVLPTAIMEATGLDATTVAKALDERKALIKEKSSGFQHRVSLYGERVWSYAIKADFIQGDVDWSDLI